MNKRVIAPEFGYVPLEGENGISSKVYEKDGNVFKPTGRNPLQRALSDYAEWVKIADLLRMGHKVQPSEIFSSEDSEGNSVVCVKQSKIKGQTLRDFGKEALSSYLKENPSERVFLRFLIDVFSLRVDLYMFYPDLVGNPGDQSLWNSINLMIDPDRGIVVCDVGLSPHEDTLNSHGKAFLRSSNVTGYVEQVRSSFRELIQGS